jgi:hypothetical protein
MNSDSELLSAIQNGLLGTMLQRRILVLQVSPLRRARGSTVGCRRARHVGTTTDFVRSGRNYDLIHDTVGNRSVPDLRRALSEGGKAASRALPTCGI